VFNLHALGWHSFQQLCLSILRECLGQTVEAFLDGNDAGRDGAFSGMWQQHGNEFLSGRFVVQCKFTKRPGYVLVRSDLSDEIAKVQRLISEGRCDVYVLLTNAGVSGEADLSIKHPILASFALVEKPNRVPTAKRWKHARVSA
jgi:Restriction endonuclease